MAAPGISQGLFEPPLRARQEQLTRQNCVVSSRAKNVGIGLWLKLKRRAIRRVLVFVSTLPRCIFLLATSPAEVTDSTWDFFPSFRQGRETSLRAPRARCRGKCLAGDIGGRSPSAWCWTSRRPGASRARPSSPGTRPTGRGGGGRGRGEAGEAKWLWWSKPMVPWCTHLRIYFSGDGDVPWGYDLAWPNRCVCRVFAGWIPSQKQVFVLGFPTQRQPKSGACGPRMRSVSGR